MRRVLLLVCVLPLVCAGPQPSPPVACGPAIAAAERARGTAAGLLGAIGLVESGRVDPVSRQRVPWPWTVTAQGVGTFYGGKAEAIAAVQALRAKGVASIDVGCMQVNLMYHGAAFRDLDEAFDPVANASYAARFLAGLYQRLGSWQTAAEAYHSMTPELGAKYGRLVAAVWSGAPVPVAVRAGGVQVVTFADGSEMRILRDATQGGGRVLGYLP